MEFCSNVIEIVFNIMSWLVFPLDISHQMKRDEHENLTNNSSYCIFLLRKLKNFSQKNEERGNILFLQLIMTRR